MTEGEIRQLAQMYALVAEIEARKCDIEGMKAENMQRSLLGQSMAYDDLAFEEVSQRLMMIAKELRESI